MGTFPAMRRYVKECLKSGVMEGLEVTPTMEGTPQGGVISPLLANIALHGMEEAVKNQHRRSRKQRASPMVVRYADDFVILHPDREVIERCRATVEAWLKEIGLELKPSKTRITHTLIQWEGNLGFDFLGFNVRQYPVGKYHSGRNGHGEVLGFKTLIKPGKESVRRHVKELKAAVRRNRGKDQQALIAELTPKIRGWANYYRTVVSKKTFSGIDNSLYSMLWAWAKWRHCKKGGKWRKQKYWRTGETEMWIFAPPEGQQLKRHALVKIVRHVKVEGNASPYDGNLVYWAKRRYDHPLTRNRLGYVLKLQKGRCAACGLYLKDGDLIELDHIIPKSLGGKDEVRNLQALHRHCHDQKTATDGSYQARGGRGVQCQEPIAR